ncbi:CHAT domain-containing protein/tetratricopeptide (TPR) repeat protein [Sphingopyxis panaciterrae]|uniref:CHAT domain-containing tetratricopeptide repeat protein n=1 Tax=Sphingopyxis panaciterrae TaxID=363841 RepID=UPI00141E87F5|nr:CHAT domain-containing protein [Sphingopyxis panaciterrae]NIJ35661.1 CHAT domain-containing protein/tetratricopeptide (TPR) repeat protein [Sphingopyxis panaciterrae]
MAATSASSSAAQFIPRPAMIPGEIAARRVAADQSGPTPAQLDQILALEREARIDQPCNTASEKILETPRRTLLRLYEETYGPGHPATARPLLSLLCHLSYNGKTAAGLAEREQFIARLVAIGRDRAQPATLFAGLDARSQLRIEGGNFDGAIEDATEALGLARRLFADWPEIGASSAGLLASAFEGAGRTTEAEPLRQEQVNLLQPIKGGDRFALAAAYEQLANNFVKQMRMADAKIWFSRELDLFEAELPDADDRQLTNVVLYSQKLFWTDPARVEALYRAVLERQEAAPASDDKRNWMTIWNLAKSARVRGDPDSAIGYQRRVIAAMGPGVGQGFALELAAMLSDRRETAAEAAGIYHRALEQDPDNPALIESYGSSLWMLGRFAEALPMRKRAIGIASARYGPGHRETLRLVQNLGVALWIEKRPAEARPYYEDVLAGYRSELSALPETANAEYRRNLSGFISSKASDLLKLYWTDRANPGQGGDAASRARGFAVAQLAHPSVSSAAISETAARSLAARAGKGEIFARWAAARDRVVALDQAITQAAQRGTGGDDDRVRLLGERAAAGQSLAVAAAVLTGELPDIFATLRPEPVPLAEVTGGGRRPPLLRKNEALVLLYPGMPDARGEMSRGVVFAVTREGSAWAEIPVDGADLARTVGDLDGQLGDGQFSGATALGTAEDPAGFLRYDRGAAHRVYRALFGDPSIAGLLDGKDRWIVVPEGPLLSLNFSALVSGSPEGGAAGDIDPAMLRATKWLGLERIISVIPSVDALRTARRSATGAWSAGTFFGLGDPAFRGIADPAPKPVPARTRGGPIGSLTTKGVAHLSRERLYRDGIADPAMLGKLPRLDYSAAEVREIARLLGASSDRQILQLDATQARVQRGSSDGTLRDSSVVLFATHALLGGDFNGALSEPALALTPGAQVGGKLDAGNDGLLTASEVAQLRFNSALIILSACDTAAGSNGGDGFSGLTRSFLLAGARAVLATYSPVVDEVGERMTTTAIAGLRGRNDLAGALRDAMREVAADRSFDARGASLAHPAAWAVYVAIDPS